MSSKKYLVILIFVLLCTLSSCSSSVVFENGKHERDDNYTSAFNTYYTICNNIEFNVEEKIFDQEFATNLYNKVLTDYHTINNSFGIESALKIFVVEATITGEIYSNKGELFCTAQAINNQSYRSSLISAYLKITEPWQITGAYEYVYGESIDNSSLLKEYYDNEDNLMTLSLFAAYFNNGFSDENTIAFADRTAISFTKYLINQYDVETFLSCENSVYYRQQWLNIIGVNKNYDMPYNLDWLDGALYSHSNEYPLIIITNNRIYNLSPISESISSTGYILTDSFDTPELIIKRISDYNSSILDVLSYIRDNAPVNYPQILSIWESTIYYYFDDGFSHSYAVPLQKEVYLKETGDFLHETIHILIPEVTGEKQIWKTEGIAEYFYCLSNVLTARKIRSYQSLILDSEVFDGDNRLFLESVQNYYLLNKPYPLSSEDFDYALFYEAIAVTTLTQSELNITNTPVAVLSVADWRNISVYQGYPGNNLTYPEAFLLAKYITDIYGLDLMISLCLNSSPYSFEQTLNITYDEISANFMASVLNLKGE